MAILKKTSPKSQEISYVVKNSKIHGNGVFATKKIPAGTTIIEYKGQRIDWKEAAKRDPHDPENPYHTFYFSLDDDRVIDGGVRGNDARWINHGCEPNCEATEENGRVFIAALRDIRRGEELKYDYSLIIDERITPSLKRAYECRCNAETCRKTMLFIKSRKKKNS